MPLSLVALTGDFLAQIRAHVWPRNNRSRSKDSSGRSEASGVSATPEGTTLDSHYPRSRRVSPVRSCSEEDNVTLVNRLPARSTESTVCSILPDYPHDTAVAFSPRQPGIVSTPGGEHVRVKTPRGVSTANLLLSFCLAGLPVPAGKSFPGKSRVQRRGVAEGERRPSHRKKNIERFD